MDPDRGRRLKQYARTSGELGSSGAQTLMVALLPVLLAPHAPSAVWIGAVIAAEGVFAMAVPYVVGAASDALPRSIARRFGRRTFFLLLTAPVMAAVLILVPFQDSFWGLAIPAFVFFAALHGFITPVRTLVVDAVPEHAWGRVHGVLGAFHAGGLGYGLVAAGLLFSAWRPLPWLIAAGLLLSMTAVTYATAPGDGHGEAAGRERAAAGGATRDSASGLAGERRFWRRLLAKPGVAWFLAANAGWTGAIDGLRPYIFLFAMTVLGITVAEASLVLLALLAGAGIGSVLVGRLGDRWGRGRLLFAGAGLTAFALLLGAVVRDVPTALFVLGPAGVGAAVLIALPFPVFAELAESPSVGRFTGVYTLSMGAARMIAPIAVGIAIDLGGDLFPEQDGFPAMWLATGALALLGALLLLRVNRATGGRLFNG